MPATGLFFSSLTLAETTYESGTRVRGENVYMSYKVSSVVEAARTLIPVPKK
jgi:hypothetical protein